MFVNDPVSDLLTRIRNSLNARHTTCEVPASRLKESILKILKNEGYISNYVRNEATPQDNLVIFLRYQGRTNSKPVVTTLKRISKLGRRVYAGYKDLKPVLGGLGIQIVSTPAGVMTDREARSKKLGGEVLCQIW